MPSGLISDSHCSFTGPPVCAVAPAQIWSTQTAITVTRSQFAVVPCLCGLARIIHRAAIAGPHKHASGGAMQLDLGTLTSPFRGCQSSCTKSATVWRLDTQLWLQY